MLTQKFGTKWLIVVAFAFIGLAIMLYSNIGAVFANDGFNDMRKPSARELWSSPSHIDEYVDGIKDRMLERDAPEQVLNSVEEYRQLLHESYRTGQPASNTDMIINSISSRDQLLDVLAERGVELSFQERRDFTKQFARFLEDRNNHSDSQ